MIDKNVIYNVECDHHDSYATFRYRNIAETIAKGCCKTARVVKYIKD